MRLEIPSLGPRSRPGTPRADGAATWQPLALGPSDEGDGGAAGDGSAAGDGGAAGDGSAAAADAAGGARYFERREPRRGDNAHLSTGRGLEAEPGGAAAPCMLIVSPLLPLPRSLAGLIGEALASEPDFRLDWKWPLLTPRAGPWELVVQLCVGTSRETGHATGRVYAALDAGFGAYLVVCIDRDPQKLAERHKELLAMLAAARLHRDRIPEGETQTASELASELASEPTSELAPGLGRPPRPAPADPTELIPPQQPPPEIYLKEALFSYLTD